MTAIPPTHTFHELGERTHTHTLTHEVMTSMRAIVAISDPCPGKYCSMPGDVEHVFGDDMEALSDGQVALKRAVRKATE